LSLSPNCERPVSPSQPSLASPPWCCSHENEEAIAVHTTTAPKSHNQRRASTPCGHQATVVALRRSYCKRTTQTLPRQPTLGPRTPAPNNLWSCPLSSYASAEHPVAVPAVVGCLVVAGRQRRALRVRWPWICPLAAWSEPLPQPCLCHVIAASWTPDPAEGTSDPHVSG
jgi:hypothetical protein